MIIHLLKMQHASAIKKNDIPTAEELEKELLSHGVEARWLSDTVLLWEDAGKKRSTTKKPDKSDTILSCSVCGATIQRENKRGRPPSKCEKHR
jgi:hypothetical protein